jgi:hypothetical protein
MSFFDINFQLMQHHKYSLSDLETMMPWERDIYVEQLRQYIETENLKNLQEAANKKSKGPR